MKNYSLISGIVPDKTPFFQRFRCYPGSWKINDYDGMQNLYTFFIRNPAHCLVLQGS